MALGPFPRRKLRQVVPKAARGTPAREERTVAAAFERLPVRLEAALHAAGTALLAPAVCERDDVYRGKRAMLLPTDAEKKRTP